MSPSHRLLVGVAAILVVATASGCGRSEPLTVTVTIRYSTFDPAAITVPAGVPVTFRIVNEDPIDHEWLVGDEAFHAAHRTGTEEAHGDVPTEVSIAALETATTTITFDEPGSLAYICHVPRHEAYGMVGVLTVEG